MSASDEDKPDGVKPETWEHHLEWMRVMESSRRYGPPMKKLMQDHFVAPDDDSGQHDSD